MLGVSVSLCMTEKMAKPPRVLIVDDQPRARASLSAVVTTLLQSDQVAEAQTGAEAVERVEAWQPDIILMDARMPQLDGIQATRQIRTKYPRVKIIVISLYPEYRADALAAGADLFLNKAGPPEQLLTALTTMAQQAAE